MGRRREFIMKKIGRTLAVCLTASILAAASAVPASAAAFRDVSGHWAETTINQWVNRGYINGYPDGTFRPKEPISRTEFAVVANHAFNFQNTRAIYFPDVAQSYWGYTEIQKAYAAGYMKGDANGTFRPKSSVTRQEAAVMLANIKGLALGGSAPYYSDNASISSWARGSVNAVSAAGYMSGYPDGSFRPKERISRAEVVTMLNKALGATGGNTNTTTPPSQTTNTAQNLTLKETTLRNTVISGNLTIPSSMSSRNITLDNVTVRGKLIVEGGGTITAEDCDINELTLDKSSVVFRAEDGTSVVKTTFRNNGTLEGEGFRAVEISNSKVSTATIDAEVDELTLDTDADVRLYGDADVDTFEITKNADDALIELSKGARVKNMNIRSDIRIAGKGDIDNMAVYVSGVRSEIEPDDLTRKSGASKPDFDWEYSGKRHESSSSSSSSSSGSNKTISDDFDGKDKEYRNVTVTDEAKVSDMTVTGDLTISKDVGNDEVTLEDIDVKGNVYVYGGGDDSVIFRNCTIRGDIISDKDSSGKNKDIVTLKFDDKTEVRGEVRILDHTTLAPYKNNNPTLDDVVVETKNVDLWIRVNVNRLKMEKAADIELESGVTIDRLETDKGIGETSVKMNGSSRIKNIDAKSDVDIKGTGTVNKITESSGADVTYGTGITVDPNGTTTEVKVTGVTVTPATASIAVGKTATLSAAITPADATNKTVTWTTSDAAVATVANGVVTGVKAGTATITVTTADGGKTAACAVTVTETTTPPKPVTEMTILPETVSMKVGDAPVVLSVASNDEAETKGIEWKIAGDEAAVITLAQEEGKDTATVTPVGEGKATVTATAKANGKIVSREITVTAAAPVEPGKDVPVTGVRISPKPLELKVGDSLKQLDAILTPSNATNRKVTWTIDQNNEIAEVNKGQTELLRTYVQAKKVGKATITVTAEGGAEGSAPITDTCEVTVSPKITVTPDGTAVEKGKPTSFTVAAEGCTGFTVGAAVKDADGTAVGGWTIASTDAAADGAEGTVTVTPAGAAENGEYTLEVTITAGGNTYTADAVTFTVVDQIIIATGITAMDSTLEVKVDEAKQISITTEPANATSGIEWKSNNGNAIVDNTGKVTGKKEGTATVSAKVGNTTKLCTVTVVQPATEVSIEDMTLEMGQTGTPRVTFKPNDVSDAAKTLKWGHGNDAAKAIVEVNEDSGLVTPKALGKASIIATTTYGDKDGNTASGNCTVTVNPGLTLTSDGSTPVTEVSVREKETKTINCRVTPEGTERLEFRITGTESTRPTVGHTDAGIIQITGKTAGTYRLTVSVERTAENGSKYKTTKEIGINVEAYAPGITIADKTPIVSIARSGNHDFAYTLRDMESPTISAKVKQGSNDSSGFTIDVGTAGKVKVTVGQSVVPGEYTLEVTATKDSETRTDSVKFTVTVPVESVSLNDTNLAMKAGGKATLTATVTPTDATNPKIVWSSDRPEVASVSQSGEVTAVKADANPVMITATAEDNSTVKATCTVTVGAAPSITVGSPSSTVIEAGKGGTLTFGYETEGFTKPQVTAKIYKGSSWITDMNPDTTTQPGKITVTVPAAAAEGTYTLEVTATEDGNTVKDNTATFTVEKAPEIAVQSVEINQIPSLTVGGTHTLSATIKPDNATDKSLTWTSSNTKVATINGTTLTAVGAGNTEVTVKAANNITNKQTVVVSAATTTAAANTTASSQPAAAAASAEPAAEVQQEAPRRMSNLFLQREAKNTVDLPEVTAGPEKTETPQETVKEPEKTAEPEKMPAEPVTTPETPTTPVTTPEQTEVPAEPTATPEKIPAEPTATPEITEQKPGVTLTCAHSFKAGETLALTGTTTGVMKNIEWSIKDAGATGAAIQNGTLSAQQAGTVTIAATIQNGATTYFTITVNAAGQETAKPAEGQTAPAAPEDPTVIQNAAASQTVATGQNAAASAQMATPQTAVLANGQTVTNVKKFQRSVGTNIALNSLGAFPANESAVWSMERVGVSGATLYNNTLMHVNNKGVILLGRTVRGADGVLSTTYYEITFV